MLRYARNQAVWCAILALGWFSTLSENHLPQPLVQIRLVESPCLECWKISAPDFSDSQFRFAQLEEQLGAALATFQKEGRIDRSLLLYLEAIEQWNRHPSAVAALGRHFFLTHDWGKFKLALAELEISAPFAATTLLLASEKDLLDGDSAAAQSKLEKLVLSGYPTEGRAKLLLAMLHVHSGQIQSAQKLLDSVQEKDLDLMDSKMAYHRLKKAMRT